ncbi:hypothetical protein Moror_15880 [Moniliophthora roreri MCA 2997]|uniref:Reverse transcriptase-rnase h-integrase n=1 Tax=Moniliophthora roreri (strain MCA 2997) TaxID=1381753 RepID=V2W282_MONRO|nr:hypothetical protein Moror_15880 [Moniliophthora roreri MCA 2997]
MPPPADPRAMSEYSDPLSFSLLDQLGQRTDGNGYPCPDINNTRSLIFRLTSKPQTLEERLTATPHKTTEPTTNNTLLYPDPTPNPDIKPKIKPTDNASAREPTPPSAADPRISGKGPSEVYADEDEDEENRIPSNEGAPPTTSLRPLTPVPTPMMQLIDYVSALCADWNAILPEIAHSTCAADASRLSLDIHLDTALTNEGLAALCVEGLVRVQTLCQMIAIMTMNLMTILEGNVEKSEENGGGDVDFLLIEADPQKVGRFTELLLVDEQVKAGWQPTQDMPDTSEDYNMELYGDGES